MPRRPSEPRDDDIFETTCADRREAVDEPSASPSSEDERQVREALAEYFTILRQWSLNSRSDDALAPDSTTEQP